MAFTPSQVQVARALTRAPLYQRAGSKVRKAELEAGIVESGLSNPTGGDRDSIGTLQQRPSQGWGSPAQLRDVAYQSQQFLKRAIPLAGKYGSAGQLAQAVQRSAFPERYDQHSAEAARLLAQLGGGGGGHEVLGSMGAAAAPAGAQQADVASLLQQLVQPEQQGSPVSQTVLSRPASAGGAEAPAGTPRVPAALTPVAPKGPDIAAVLQAVQRITQDGAPEATAPEGAEGHANAAEVAAGSSHYINPLPGFAKGRTDQGVDYSAKPGAPIKAIGNGKVLGIMPDWFKGQPYLYYELSDGPQKGKIVYVAEQITPHVKPGQSVRAGQTIGVYAPIGTGIETGFSTRSGATQARVTSGYTEGQETPSGKQARQLLERLGAR